MKFVPQLNSIRTIAVFLVIASHYFHSTDVYDLGYAGVNLFFYLSGFLITTLMLKDSRLIDSGKLSKAGAIGNFYMRRALRIFPLYYAVIVLMYVLGSKTGTLIRNDIAYYLLYIPNVRFYFEQRWDGSLSHFWSLGVEEQYYLCWPFVFFFSNRKYIPRILLVMGLLSVGYKISMSVQTTTVFFHILLVNCIYKFCMGALVIFYLDRMGQYFKPRKVLLHLLLLMSIIIYGAVSLFPFNLSWMVKDLAVFFLFAYLLLYSLKIEEGAARRLLSLKFMVYLGTISYGLYVFHLLTPWFLENALNKVRFLSWVSSSAIFYPICIAATIAVSHLSYYYYEGWFLKLKEKFSPKHTRMVNKSFASQRTTA